jgi:AraC-like DNA-binding protein
MVVSEIAHDVIGKVVGGVLLERHRYPPGPAGAVPPHVHDDYQVCLSIDFPGEYRVNRAVHAVPVGSLSIINPGDVHTARDPVDRHGSAGYLVAYLPADRVARVADDIRPVAALPVFPAPVFADPHLADAFTALHAATRDGAPPLESDERLLAVVASLLLRHQDRRSDPPRMGRESRAVAVARSYLHAHPHEPVALADLARVTELSPFHLVRAFRAEVGLPPHAYHLALRVERAKEPLATGYPAASVAAETGFFDQSHLSRHFRRLVGTTPGRYGRRGKNVQEFSDVTRY